MMRTGLFALSLTALPLAATAEVDLSLYGGWQTAPHSDVTVNDPVITGGLDETFFAEWEGRSFEMPPYYGIRATYWSGPTLGFGVDFTHAKVYATDETLRDNGYDRLEFTDGINTLTVNAYRRWPGAFGDVTPYVGAGLGLSIPYVEVEKNGSSTLGYQVTGPAATLLAGASYELNDRWSLFGEYKFTYTSNKADLDTGGTIESDIILNALNVGITYSF